MWSKACHLLNRQAKLGSGLCTGRSATSFSLAFLRETAGLRAGLPTALSTLLGALLVAFRVLRTAKGRTPKDKARLADGRGAQYNQQAWTLLG